MTCQEFREIISLYIDNELNKNEIKKLEMHIKDCPECMKEYEELKRIKELLADMPTAPLPDKFKDEVHQKLVDAKDELDNEDAEMEVVTFKDKKEESSKKKIRFNWKTLSAIAAVLLLMVISITGLDNLMMGIKSQEHATESAPRVRMEEDTGSADSNFGMMSEKAVPEVAEAPKEKIELTDNADLGGTNDSYNLVIEEERTENGMQQITESQSDRKIILNGFMQIDTEDYDMVQEGIINLVLSKGGFIQNSHTGYKIYNREDPNKSLKSGNLTIRIPQIEFYNMYNEIQSLGIVVNESINSDDITKQYRDVNSEVENLKVQEKRLREILNKAKDVTEILEVERELNRVRGEINRLSGNLKNWDDLVQLSTIEVDLNEITFKDMQIQTIDEDNILERAKKGFIRTTNSMINLMEVLFITFVSYIPVLLVLAILLMMVYWIIRKLLKR